MKKTCVDLLDTATGIENMTTFLPVSVTAENKATQCPCQNSGDLVKILSSDGYIELPPKAVYYQQEVASYFTLGHKDFIYFMSNIRCIE